MTIVPSIARFAFRSPARRCKNRLKAKVFAEARQRRNKPGAFELEY
jgi:hypothetical protein